MKEIRMKAQITVLAALTIVIVMSLICATIRSAVDTAVKVRANMAANLAMESVFANYSRPLADKFNILLLPSSESIGSAIFNKACENCVNDTGFGKAVVQSVEITDKESPVDNGGAPFAKEVLKYMQHGIFSEFSQMLMGHEKQLEKEKKTGELISEITECEEDVSKIDALILELISLVEGLDNENGFLKCSGGQPVPVTCGFVKKLCPDEVYAQSVYVKDARVFSAMKNHYTDVKALLEDIKEDADDLYNADEDTPQGTIRRIESALSSEISDFEELTGDAVTKCEDAIEVCNMYISAQNTIEGRAAATEKNIEKSRNTIGNDIANGLSEDIKKIKAFSTDDAMCDVKLMQIALRDMLPYFMTLEKYAENMRECYDRDDYSGIWNEAEYAVSTVNAIDYSALEFNYSNVDFKSSSANKKLLTSMRNVLSKGIMGIVVGDVSAISDKKIPSYNLADTLQDDALPHYDSMLTEIKNNILYNEYVLMHFTSYKDVTGKKDAHLKESFLDYQVEYILNGCDSDYDNLFMTVLSLSGIRECTNLIYLFTDAAKKEECYALAFTLFGFTGMPALVTIGQYAIMALWAYAESLVEIRQLLDGGRAELTKSAANWNLSLEGLMSMQLENNEKKSDKGLDYEQFLRVLLLMEKDSHKYFRTMAQIELWMIKNGFADFRMKNQLNALGADITFKLGGYGKGKFYVQPVSYSY